MTALIKMIDQAFFPGAWAVYLVAAVLAWGAGVASGTYIMHLIDAPKLAASKQETAEAKAATAAEVALYNDLQSRMNAAAAVAAEKAAALSAKAAEQSRADAGMIAKLQAKLTAEQTAHAKTSAQLTAELNHASSSEDRELGPAFLRFLNGVRDRQAAAGTAAGTSGP